MRRPPTGRRSLRSDDGSLTVFTTIALAALMLFAGVVLDLGAALDAKVRALHAASEAARMGAQQLDLPALHRRSARVLNPGAAQKAARKFLAAADTTGNATATATAVSVNATAHQRTWLLEIVGISHIAMSASATASPETTSPTP